VTLWFRLQHKVDGLLHIGSQTQCRGQLKHIGTDQTHKSHTLPNSKGILHIGDLGFTQLCRPINRLLSSYTRLLLSVPTLSHKCWFLLGDLTRRLLSVPTGLQQGVTKSELFVNDPKVCDRRGPNTRLYISRKNPGNNLYTNVHTLVCQTNKGETI
jgi:hypothetical protein